jgi:D-tyrosyl-tRNA(Tyr) deacylase
MRVVIQRVREAEVTVDDVSVGRIGPGLVLLVGLAHGDGEPQLEWMARKVAGLRVFDDATGPSRASVVEVGGGLLAISQFTVVADCHKGRRPSYDAAMPSAEAARLFARFVELLRGEIAIVETGRFGATMHVHLVNDGPFTLVLDAPRPRDLNPTR